MNEWQLNLAINLVTKLNGKKEIPQNLQGACGQNLCVHDTLF